MGLGEGVSHLECHRPIWSLYFHVYWPGKVSICHAQLQNKCLSGHKRRTYLSGTMPCIIIPFKRFFKPRLQHRSRHTNALVWETERYWICSNPPETSLVGFQIFGVLVAYCQLHNARPALTNCAAPSLRMNGSLSLVPKITILRDYLWQIKSPTQLTSMRDSGGI